MTTSNKDTIYIDIDEEITGIIDKVRSSPGKIVALVLPKRASVLQSIVNMKLLKRSADEAKKNLVLITSEAGLLPLAGSVGLFVAKTPQSKPEIPTPPQLADDSEETIDETGAGEFSKAAAANRPVGELAAAGAIADDMETLELDDDEETALAASSPLAAAAPKKVKKDSKLAVPNFERFRLLLVVGVLGLILLIGGLFYALTVLPKAEIAVTTNASNVNVGLDLVLDTAAKKVDAETGVMPAKLASVQKNFTQQAPATGQKNNGDRAQGDVVITNCSEEDELTVPAGTGLSSAGLTYITQKSVTFELSGKTNSGCKVVDGFTSSAVGVLAQTGGANFNLPAGSNFTVAGFTGLTAKSDDPLAGGTDNIVKIVSQADIDAAKQKITSTDSSVKSELRKQLQNEGLSAITATYVAGTPAFTNSSNPGSVADTVTVTAAISYTMFGVKSDDLESLVRTDIKSQIDTAKQGILNAGLDEALYKVGTISASNAEVKFETTSTVGPDVDANELKQQVAGKKGGDVKKLLQGNPGITDVQIRLSPFFVTSVPKNPEKITITIAKPTPAPSNAD